MPWKKPFNFGSPFNNWTLEQREKQEETSRFYTQAVDVTIKGTKDITDLTMAETISRPSFTKKWIIYIDAILWWSHLKQLDFFNSLGSKNKWKKSLRDTLESYCNIQDVNLLDLMVNTLQKQKIKLRGAEIYKILESISIELTQRYYEVNNNQPKSSYDKFCEYLENNK